MEEKDKLSYTRISDEEVKKIAEDIYKGLIFTDRHISNPNDLTSVFMVLMFMEEKDINRFKNNPPGLIYEYMDKAGPMTINGNPIFMSMQLLSKEDGERVIKHYTGIKDIVENFEVKESDYGNKRRVT